MSVRRLTSRLVFTPTFVENSGQRGVCVNTHRTHLDRSSTRVVTQSRGLSRPVESTDFVARLRLPTESVLRGSL
ncbi:hypothetical protein E4P24_14720 [Haloferax sp. AS1]|nr:hypothetical protein [Haloferax sp. AS1]